ncbi:hypothetical protein [Variovorax sp.]|jgi:hypothetical protein|uniref:hypothetical protein n=1 Tax=Variovorax sp. TaxID=1871043 RepID=UPI0037DA31CD
MSPYSVDSPANVFEGASTQSGVSWGAIIAGAAGAASLSLVLLLLGTGLGMSSVSPWAREGASATAIGIATILWLSFTQIAASGLGGYLAGRLRTKWAGVHTDEVYFRDTAHGFLAWAVATLVTAALLSSAVGAILGAGAQAGSAVAGGAATAAVGASAGAASSASQSGTAAGSGPLSYFVDSLFRQDAGTPVSNPSDAGTSTVSASPSQDRTASNAEVTRIFVNSVATGALPPEDTKYVAQVVSQRTGITQQDAEKRVSDVYAKAEAALRDTQAKAKQAADAARKSSAYTALWLVVSMLIGAFIASFAATYGGRRRDL